MAALLHSLIDMDREADCVANDAALMRAFLLVFGAKESPRQVIEVRAPDSFTAIEQHDCLREGNERLEAVPLVIDVDAMRCAEAL